MRLCILGNQLMTLQRSYFRAEMEDNQFQQLQLAIRLSACEGVQQMFQTYSTHKHTQVHIHNIYVMYVHIAYMYSIHRTYDVRVHMYIKYIHM